MSEPAKQNINCYLYRGTHIGIVIRPILGEILKLYKKYEIVVHFVRETVSQKRNFI